MLWPNLPVFGEFINDCDIVLMFIGAMESEDTEQFDRRTAEFNPNYEMFINCAVQNGKKVVVVMQSGSAMILGDWRHEVQGIVQMWLGGEGSGGAIADILCGKINPSGKLSETFPVKVRSDLEYPGNKYTVQYTENIFVGYRYYDIHPEKIVYPFGFGLSYTEFEYSDIDVQRKENKIYTTLKIKNIGKTDGAEVVQLYVGDPASTVVRPVKELKGFTKVFLSVGEEKEVKFIVDKSDVGYYNVLLKEWVTEPGEYIIYIGASSRDIRLKKPIYIDDEAPYTTKQSGETMIG